MVDMLVWGGGWAWVGCCLRVGGKNRLFLAVGPLYKGSIGSTLARGYFLEPDFCRKGSGGSTFARGLLSELSLHCKGPGGSLRDWGLLSKIGFRRKGSGWSRRVQGLVLGSDPRRKVLWGSARARGCCVLHIRNAFGGGGCVLGHGAFIVLPIIVWWGTVGSTLGAGSVSISVTKCRILLPGTPI